ncbi:HD domain-containing protein [Kribbella qitaiheensis]|uniref:HD domain-containing protein n=1 Tax=Kribbella qitaiheensis TaxID=1544730 RepID=UPI0019D69D0C
MSTEAALVTWAATLAQSLLEQPLPRRWAHTIGVAEAARELAPGLRGMASTLEAAAWLHDIGYSPVIAASGFHPADGARYLRDGTDCGPHDLLPRGTSFGIGVRGVRAWASASRRRVRDA